MTSAGRPSLVVFDCDGVLVDSERLEPGTLAEALTRVDGGEQLDAAELHRRHRGRVLTNLFALVEAELGRPLPESFGSQYRELQSRRLEEVEEIPGARAAVDIAVDSGVARCIVSGGTMAKMRVSLGVTGFWPAFAPHIYSCYDIADHKPSPGIYLHVLERFGVDPAGVLAIEDSVVGVTAAARAGVEVIGLARDTAAVELAEAGASLVVDSMDEFATLLTERL